MTHLPHKRLVSVPNGGVDVPVADTKGGNAGLDALGWILNLVGA